jgi:peptide/nickel transport system permease protein
MISYTIKRLFFFIFVLFVTSALTFSLIHLLKPNPVVAILGYGYTHQQFEQLTAQLGLNKPIYAQYFIWMWHNLHGNLGVSYASGQTVASIVRTALPIDVEIALISQVMALSVAIPLAIGAARRPNGLFDRMVTSTAFVFLAIPTFVSIIVLQDLLATEWHVPDTAPGIYLPGGDWVTNLLVLILPSFAIALGSFVVYYRVLRSDLISTYLEDFITLARSKGLSRRRIVWRHAFRPSSLALITTVALVIAGTIGGVFVVEFLCGIPGLGFELINASTNSDYPLAQGIIFVLTGIVIILLFAVDLFYSLVDPRIALE